MALVRLPPYSPELRELQNIKIPFIMSSNFKSIGDEYEDIYFESKWHIITSNKFDRAFD
jgi:hypothetical protein